MNQYPQQADPLKRTEDAKKKRYKFPEAPRYCNSLRGMDLLPITCTFQRSRNQLPDSHTCAAPPSTGHPHKLPASHLWPPFHLRSYSHSRPRGTLILAAWRWTFCICRSCMLLTCVLFMWEKLHTGTLCSLMMYEKNMTRKMELRIDARKIRQKKRKEKKEIRGENWKIFNHILWKLNRKIMMFNDGQKWKICTENWWSELMHEK